jgi:A/G-specific adenine glycosylase
MSEAPVDEVLASLKPLGLVWRAHSIHQCAEMIVQKHGGVIPLEEAMLLELPGVGPYVAGSVRAIAGESVLLTDTNTVRVAARTKGIVLKGDIRRRSDVQTAIKELLGGPAKARDWWAVIDLAASLCRPVRPMCTNCPIREYCATGRSTCPSDKDRDHVGKLPDNGQFERDDGGAVLVVPGGSTSLRSS